MAEANVQKASKSCQVPDTDLIPDVIPYLLPGGGISLLAGAPNLGKTALLASLFRDLRDGRPIFGHQPRAVPGIGLICADRGWRTGAGVWFERAGFPEITRYVMRDDGFSYKRLRNKFDRPDVLFSLIDSLKLPPLSVVSVDPISLFLGGNLLDYDLCASAAGQIGSYLREKRYTMLSTAHTAKLKADKRERYMRMTDQMFGSTAISGFSDSQLYLAGPQELGKSYYMLVWHPHAAKEEQHLLDRDEHGLFTPWLGADAPTLARVLSLFPEPPATVALAALVELAQVFPLSKSTVHRVLDRLMLDGAVERAGRGQYRKATIN